jgi:hypothetical protein
LACKLFSQFFKETMSQSSKRVNKTIRDAEKRIKLEQVINALNEPEYVENARERCDKLLAKRASESSTESDSPAKKKSKKAPAKKRRLLADILDIPVPDAPAFGTFSAEAFSQDDADNNDDLLKKIGKSFKI